MLYQIIIIVIFVLCYFLYGTHFFSQHKKSASCLSNDSFQLFSFQTKKLALPFPSHLNCHIYPYMVCGWISYDITAEGANVNNMVWNCVRNLTNGIAYYQFWLWDPAWNASNVWTKWSLYPFHVFWIPCVFLLFCFFTCYWIPPTLPFLPLAFFV